MVVAVSKGLCHIGEQLRNMGYEVVKFGEYRYPIDALIYMHDENKDTLSNFTASNFMGEKNAVFMINAENKSIGEIVSALQSRLYKPLF